MSSMMGNTGLQGSTGSPRGLKGTGYKQATIQNFTPEQMQLFQQLFSQVGSDSYLNKLAGGDQSTFEQIEAPARKGFSALQGGIANRFSGGGGLGTRHSSGFQNRQNQAASDFAGKLASNRQSLQQQAIRDLLGLGNDLLQQRPYESYMVKNQESSWPKWIGASLPWIGATAGGLLGGPPGAMIGGSVGGAASKAFF